MLQPMQTNAATPQLDVKTLQNSFSQPPTQKAKELKKAAQDFEAVFMQQLLTAMDATVNREDSILSGGEAEKTFRGMLNQQMATNITHTPNGKGFGLAESIYQQSILMFNAEDSAKKATTEVK